MYLDIYLTEDWNSGIHFDSFEDDLHFDSFEDEPCRRSTLSSSKAWAKKLILEEIFNLLDIYIYIILYIYFHNFIIHSP